MSATLAELSGVEESLLHWNERTGMLQRERTLLLAAMLSEVARALDSNVTVDIGACEDEGTHVTIDLAYDPLNC